MIPLLTTMSTTVRLDAPISLWLRCEPLADVVAHVGDASGLRLRLESRLLGQKAAVFVTNRPTSEVLRMLATAFLAEWRQTDAGLKLVERADFSREEDAANASERAEGREGLTRLMSTVSELSQAFPKEPDLEACRVAWILSREDDVEKRAEALRRGEELKLRRVPCLGASVTDAGLAARELANETTVCVPLREAGGAVGNGRESKAAPFLGYSLVRYLPGCGTLQCRDAPFVGKAPEPVSVGVWATERRTGAAPLFERMSAWAGVRDLHVAQAPLRPAERPPDPTAEGGSVVDRLEWLAKASGTPIVADSFRLFVPCRIPDSARCVGDVLEALRSPNELNVGERRGFVRTERGWLVYRHPRFWSIEGQEPPEAGMRRLESTFSRDGGLGVEAYAEFAAALSERQADAFRGRLPMRAAFPTAPLESAVSFFGFWGNLSAEQRRSATTSGLRLQGRAGSALRRTLSDFLWERPDSNEASCEKIYARGWIAEPTLLRRQDFRSDGRTWTRIEVELRDGDAATFDMPLWSPGPAEKARPAGRAEPSAGPVRPRFLSPEGGEPL